MRIQILVAAVLVMIVAAQLNAATAGGLRCEGRVDPLGIDEPRPRLGWKIRSDRRGEVQSAYQVLVASSREHVEKEQGDLWDSGKVTSDESAYVEYAGRPLVAGQRAWWTVRVWDREGKPSNWSEPAQWTMGLLSPEDWKGKWIGARTISPHGAVAPNGFHAKETRDANEVKWVQVDLGERRAVDEVRLYPARPNNYEPQTPGFGFPVRFKVEASDDPSFKKATLIADQTGVDVSNPGNDVVSLRSPAVSGRFVRVTGTRHWVRKDGVACFAFSEIEVTSGGRVVSAGRPVTAADAVEAHGWSLRGTTDGYSVQRQEAEPAYAAPLLRTAFEARKKLIRATATICGLGYYELYLNGRKVGDHVLDPGFTRFDRRVLYETYDVTGMVKQGRNAVGVMLGGGWYELATPDLFGFERAPWTAPPKVIAQIDMEFDDGSRQTVATDEGWRWSTGHIVFQCVRGGETHDFRKARPGWSTAEYDDGEWQQVKLVPAPAGKLLAQRAPAIRTNGEIPVVKVAEPKPGVYVFHLAENTAGWARFRTKGKEGQKVTLRFGERLEKDGTISRGLSSHTYGRWQTGEMILTGKGVDTYEPHFTYHGFQYVQVEGLTERPGADDLVGVRVHTRPEPIGTFACSDALINRIQEMSLRTYLCNLHSIPTDCPQREKMGWLCDGMVASEMALMNFDVGRLYAKWTDDMADAQSPAGSVPAIVPTSGWGEDGRPGADFQCPWWGGAIVVVPWNVYQYTGDTRVLARHYESMRRFVDNLTSRADKDHIVSFGLGDWLEVGAGGKPSRTPIPLTSTAAYAWYARIVSGTASMLGKRDDAAKYAELSEVVGGAFNRTFLRHPGLYGEDTQTAPALSLVLDLAPPGQRDLIASRLIENIVQRRHGHVSTGLVGTLYLFKALQQLGQDDLAYRVATAKGFPGYMHMLDSGATTLWEDWAGVSSHNHPAFGAVGGWFYSGIGGINLDPSTSGFKKIVIRPAIVGGLTWANVEHETVYGPVRCSWRRGEKLEMNVSVPPNTTATVFVPASNPDVVNESGKPVREADGVRFLRTEGGYAVFAIGSGTYRFESPLPAGD